MKKFNPFPTFLSRQCKLIPQTFFVGVVCWLLSSISITNAVAQPTKEWDRTFGGKGYNDLKAILQTADGGYILGGTSNSNAGGDKTENSKGNNDYWVVKLNAAGQKEWDKTFGGTNNDELKGLQLTSDGGYILGGTSNSNASGNKSDNSKGGYYGDYWVVKLDAQGNKVWDKTLGGSESERFKSLQQTADGGYILGGESYSEAGGDKTENSKGGYDYWIVKLNVAGQKEWDKTFGGAYDDFFYSFQQTNDKGYILGGESHSYASGDKTDNPKGNQDYWVIKLNVAGQKEWDKTIGGNDFEILRTLSQTSDGGYILGGVSGSNAGGDKSENSKGAINPSDDRGIFDYWVVKLNATGSKEWDKTIGGAGFDDFQYLQQTTDGGYILGGTSESNVGGDKSQDNRGRYGDYWVVKLNTTGSKEWDKTLGGGFSDDFSSLQQTRDGGYILGGTSTTAFAGFDKSEDNAGITDYWIVKLASPPAEPTLKTSGLPASLYCAGSTLSVSFIKTVPFSSSEIFKVQLSNASGSFTSPVIIGTGTTSPIAATIPTNMAPGKGYRIRVVSSSSPVAVGSDNGTDVIISSSASYQSLTIKGDVRPCTPTAVYSVSGTIGFTDFTWTLPAGWTIIAGQGTNSITVTLSKTSGIITLVAKNMCGAQGTGHLMVQTEVVPSQPGPIITSASMVCPGDTVTYSTAPINQDVPSASYFYDWIVPDGWDIISGHQTNSITLRAGVEPGLLSVYVVNYCGVSPKRSLEVNSSGPATPVVTSSSICGPGSVTLTASGAPATGSYRWYTSSSGNTAIPLATTSTYTTPVLTSTTTYYVSTLINTCESVRVPVTATIHIPPVVKAIASSDTVITGKSTTLMASGAISYRWSPTIGLSSSSGAIITATPTVSTVYTVTGTDANGCISKDLVAITVNKALPNPIHINAGATAFLASGNRQFIADQYFGGTAGTSSIASGDILNTTDDVLYRTERSSSAFTYSIPVENGSVNVVLHFAEIWFGVSGRGTGGVGSRRFNVDIEGNRKLTNYDIFAKAGGALRAIQETIPVTVTDGVLNINFLSGAANKPKISAIEIVPQTTLANVAPVLAAIGNKTIKVNQTISFIATATDANAGQTKAYSLIGAPSGATINPSTGVFTWNSTTAGTFSFTVRVTDNGSPVLADEEQINITVQNNAVATIRLNSGGKVVATSLGSFSADSYLIGATEVSTKVVSIANTTDDVLYQDYRKAVSLQGSFGYSIPVTNGTYTVKLHFAEVFYTAKGKRVFHVNAEGVRWLTNYDIFAAAGGANRAVVTSRTVTVSDGKLDLILTSVMDRASISAIEVLPVISGARVAFNSKEEANSLVEASLYPNPVTDKLTVCLLGSAQQLVTTITDVTGAVHGHNTHRIIDDTRLEISVSSLPPAIYLLQIQTQQGWQTLKFVKQ